MAGLIPAIHVEQRAMTPDVDHRDKPGDDDLRCVASLPPFYSRTPFCYPKA